MSNNMHQAVQADPANGGRQARTTALTWSHIQEAIAGASREEVAEVLGLALQCIETHDSPMGRQQQDARAQEHATRLSSMVAEELADTAAAYRALKNVYASTSKEAVAAQQAATAKYKKKEEQARAVHDDKIAAAAKEYQDYLEELENHRVKIHQLGGKFKTLAKQAIPLTANVDEILARTEDKPVAPSSSRMAVALAPAAAAVDPN
ncbi:hypothetical protein LPJ61_000271 [Coemansia biformis]|uniref:Uncharacterized protein n=1 Tax=Coemansia biformis TaxID=1286918 RepID=A0A9W7YHE9_9FUNG|nr:hypothetical protein LPJ61_000271 [Coemansia biformis]